MTYFTTTKVKEILKERLNNAISIGTQGVVRYNISIEKG